MAEKKTDSKPPETAPTHLRIVSRVEGFRRAGRAWSTQPTVVALADLTEQQRCALQGEPRLAVAVCTPG